MPGVRTISTAFPAAVFILLGLDRHWGWSSVPAVVVMAADLLALLGSSGVLRLFTESEFASRTVVVLEWQRVISTGLKTIVRPCRGG
jgi:hypothetical protein